MQLLMNLAGFPKVGAACKVAWGLDETLTNNRDAKGVFPPESCLPISFLTPEGPEELSILHPEIFENLTAGKIDDKGQAGDLGPLFSARFIEIKFLLLIYSRWNTFLLLVERMFQHRTGQCRGSRRTSSWILGIEQGIV